MPDQRDRSRGQSGTQGNTFTSETDAELATLIEILTGSALTEGQRTALRESLAAQTAAVAVLRQFNLSNRDAPCFMFAATPGLGDG